jgi:hypothetical protein
MKRGISSVFVFGLLVAGLYAGNRGDLPIPGMDVSSAASGLAFLCGSLVVVRTRHRKALRAPPT